MSRMGAWCLSIVLMLATAVAAADELAEKELLQLEERLVEKVETLIDETPLVTPEVREKAEDLIRAGIEQHDRGKYRKAIASYESALKIDPLNAIAHYELAMSWSALGDQRKAYESAVVTVALDPKIELAHVVKANVLDDLGFPDLALKAFAELLEVQPNSLLGRVNAAVTLMRAGRLDEAEEHLGKALEFAPEHPSPHLRLAEVARVRGDVEGQQRHLARFLEVGPEDPRAPMARQWLASLGPGGAPAAAGPAAEEPDPDSLTWLQAVFGMMEESEHLYVLEVAEDSAVNADWERSESERLRKLDLKGTDRVKCRPVGEWIAEAQATQQVTPLLRALRCHRPGSAEWSDLSRACSSFNRRLQVLGVPTGGSISEEEGQTRVRTPQFMPWMAYYTSKATWRHEPILREAVGSGGRYRPDVAEEYFALVAAVEADVNLRDEKDPEEVRDPLMDRLGSVAQSGLLRGYVLFELLHAHHGVDIRSLSPEDAQAVDDYVAAFVLRARE